MTLARPNYIISIISFFFLLPLAGSIGNLSGQISGVVNSYAKVTSVGADFVIVDDVSAFATGDTVLLIQMKGVGVSSVYNPALFGIEESYNGQPGFYEFILIEQVETGPKKITFRNSLIGTYDPTGMVQLIKVPSYDEVSIDGTLTCDKWDVSKGTGGIVAIIARNKVSLNAGIDVSGKGFRGAIPASVNGDCADVSGDSLYYHTSMMTAGRKGEGLATHIEGGVLLDTNKYAKGKQYISTAGGGGNGQFAGGGGGGGFGNGGSGYKEDCSAIGGGKGGEEIVYANLSGRVFMGSGGGSSGYTTGSASRGGNGGGMVFILTDTIAGNGFTIVVSGDSASTITSGQAGAGGGGSGGSIIISSSTFDPTDLNLVATGGHGGHTQNFYGSGGGGSGGFIWTKTSLSGNITTNINGGLQGRIGYPGLSRGGSPGEGGIVRNDLKLLLNGFLFNSIVSTETSTQTDSICFNEYIPDLKGTDPVGGAEPYTFKWQRSYNEIAWTDLAPVSRDLINHGQETDTVWFRRIVTDSTPITAMTDTSKPVLFLVQPLIADNLIGYNDTLCYGQVPATALVPTNPGPTGGNGIYTYMWIDSTLTDPGWPSSTGINTNSDYSPPALYEPTYYRREVTSGRCVDTSLSVTVYVWPVIDHASNTLAADQTICNDQLFADLTGSLPSGGEGAGSYTYFWESSTDNISFADAEGLINLQNYDPDETSPNFPGDQYYRRIVKSGYNDVCADASDTVHLKNWPDIGDNIISPDQTICEGDIPIPITGLDATGGDGVPAYVWQDSIRGDLQFNDIPLENGRDYIPGMPLADTTWYRRLVFSSACNDTSNVIVVEVHPAIVNNSASTMSLVTDTTICEGQTPATLVGTSPGGGTEIYVYEWMISYDNSTFNTAPGTADQKNYSPQAQVNTCWIFRRVISGECSTNSDTINIVVLPPISNNTISANQTVCYNTQPQMLTGSDPLGGDGNYIYLWEESTDDIAYSAASGTNNQKNYQPPVLTNPKYYRRTVYSGLSDCCQNIGSSIAVGIHPLPTGTIIALKDTTCSGEEITVNLNLTGTAPWNIVLNDGTADISFPAATPAYDFKNSPVNNSTDPFATFDYSFAGVTDANGCVATSMTGVRTVIVYMNPSPDPGNDDEVCGLTYTLQATPSGSWAGQWSSYSAILTAVADLNSSNNQIEVQDWGIWRFWWKETNWLCVDSASVDITFWEPPAPAYAGPDSVLVPFEYEFRLLGSDPTVGTGTWSVVLSGGSPSFDDENLATTWVRNLYNGGNKLKWTIVNGICPPEEDEVILTVKTIFIPQGFSPNGDAFNQTFKIEGLEFTTNQLVVTNLTGAVVFRADNYSSDWEGIDMQGSALPDGTYYYYLTIGTPVPRKYNGFVIIKR
ncbi:MAG TPA: gliding motility-associated C-terminal domain-containing protein [Bacteroidales bacterium]|nr:gliding motility-associated C-terminal domain-containing protein [Bacteroidales bacterium]